MSVSGNDIVIRSKEATGFEFYDWHFCYGCLFSFHSFLFKPFMISSRCTKFVALTLSGTRAPSGVIRTLVMTAKLCNKSDSIIRFFWKFRLHLDNFTIWSPCKILLYKTEYCRPRFMFLRLRQTSFPFVNEDEYMSVMNHGLLHRRPESSGWQHC